MGGCIGGDATLAPEHQQDKYGKKDDTVKDKDYVASRFIMGKTLGKGGSCRVVKAQYKTDKSYAALKIMAKKDKMNQELYTKEWQILQKVQHSNIIRLIEYFEDPSYYYILTGLCEGGELFDRIVDKDRKITEKQAAMYIKSLLEALQSIHKKNIVHRDLKPENLMFQDDSDKSPMILIDFGCAKVVEDDKVYKDLVGTPYYLAPESAAGHKYTRTGAVLKSSDVWSAGVIAYVMVTGRPPFNGHSNTEIFANIIKKPLKFPQGIKISKPLKALLKRMMKKSPKQRIKLDDCLNDPWVTGKEAKDEEISPDVIKVLRQFQHQSRLKKAITKTLAEHMGKEPMKKIEGHFQRLDKDGNGKLDSKELAVLLTSMELDEEKAKEEAAAIISAVDLDNSGTIEFKEFAVIWQRKLLCVNNAYIKAVFDVLDEDKSGKISAAELKKVLSKEDQEKVDEIIADVDKDKDGEIDFNEFKDAMKETNKKAIGRGMIDGSDIKDDKNVSAADVDNSNVDELGDEEET